MVARLKKSERGVALLATLMSVALMTILVVDLTTSTALGYRAGAIAYGLMISAHATSIVFLLGHWLRDLRFRSKLALGLGTLLVVWLLIYSPTLGLVERHWIMPLRVRDQVVVVSRGIASISVKRGDWVAYEISGAGGQGLYLQAGFGVERVLALQ